MNNYKEARFTESIHYKCLEDLRESSMELSLIHCGKEKCTPNHKISGLRDEIIIHFIFHGKGTFIIGGKSWNLSSGDMFILYPGVTTTYVSDSIDPWYYGWIAFKGIHTDNILHHCGFSKETPVAQYDNVNLAQDYIDRILNARQLSFGNDLIRNGLLLEFLGSLSEIHFKNSTIIGGHDYSSNIYVNHAIEYISKYYPEHITVSSIAEYIGITRVHLNNCFKKELGITVQSYLIDYRLHQASQLLSSSTYSISQISDMVGYPDPLAFSKAFKKRLGMSPRSFRGESN